MKRWAISMLVALLGIGGALPTPGRAGPPAAESYDAVLAWNEITAQATVDSGASPLFDPLHESRLYAMVGIAVHDALNTIERRSQPYAFNNIDLVPGASPQAAVATA